MADLLFELAGLHYGEMLRHKLTAEPEPTAGLGFHVRPYAGLNLSLYPNGQYR